MWIHKEAVFEGIVPLDSFLAAQEVLTERSKRLTDEELLNQLRALYAECGRLSGFIIDQVANGSSSSLYASRFGSLIRAYELIGYRPPGGTEHLEINRRLRELHPEIIARTEHIIAELGDHIRRDPKNDLLTLNDELVISLVLSRYQTTPTGHPRWRIRFDPARLCFTGPPDITVAIRLDPANTQKLDYFLLPRLDLPVQEICVSNKNSADFECFRLDDLTFFYGMSEGGGACNGVSDESDESDASYPADLSIPRKEALWHPRKPTHSSGGPHADRYPRNRHPEPRRPSRNPQLPQTQHENLRGDR
ncbi:hypothetical protein [Azonexus sp. IMCC34839]|uniref:hypothetical protein n=1 Tax=Azonexus sp. IMCC34839 TaxID=3133695 RepID=UPI00399C3416